MNFSHFLRENGSKCPKLLLFGAPDVTFFQNFRILRACVRKLVGFLQTHVLTLRKKEKKFFVRSFSKKINGGAGHLMPKKRKILGRQKFLAEISAGMAGNRPDENFGCTSPPHSRNFDLDH